MNNKATKKDNRNARKIFNENYDLICNLSRKILSQYGYLPLRSKDLVNQVYFQTVSIIKNYNPNKTQNLTIRSYFILQSKFIMFNYCRKYYSKNYHLMNNYLTLEKYQFLIKSSYHEITKISNSYAREKLNQTEYLLYDCIVNKDMSTNQIITSKYFTRAKLNILIENILNKMFA